MFNIQVTNMLLDGKFYINKHIACESRCFKENSFAFNVDSYCEIKDVKFTLSSMFFLDYRASRIWRHW